LADFAWLLNRGYAHPSSLKLVGDHYRLTARQRLAVRRSACTDEARAARRARQTSLAAQRGGAIGIDGYNLLITVESALSGGLVLIGRDGCYRDLASVHGTYRKVSETTAALHLIMDHLDAATVGHVDWYLDRPVSNSGQLKTLIAELLEKRDEGTPRATTWNIELMDSPDAVLASYPAAVATSDSAVLDSCGPWLNLAREIIEARIPQAWCLDLRAGRTV